MLFAKYLINTNISADELNNIATNIEHKLVLLNIKLPKLAEIADVDYFTLRKILNREANYLPNLRVLIKLANFFNITAGDLLKFNKLPQYIPIIDIENINNFIYNKLSNFEMQNTIFCETYIHEKAFCIPQNLEYLNMSATMNNICYPVTEFVRKGMYIVNLKQKICIINVLNIQNDTVSFILKEGVLQTEDITNISAIALVVKFLINQNL